MRTKTEQKEKRRMQKENREKTDNDNWNDVKVCEQQACNILPHQTKNVCPHTCDDMSTKTNEK